MRSTGTLRACVHTAFLSGSLLLQLFPVGNRDRNLWKKDQLLLLMLLVNVASFSAGEQTLAVSNQRRHTNNYPQHIHLYTSLGGYMPKLDTLMLRTFDLLRFLFLHYVQATQFAQQGERSPTQLGRAACCSFLQPHFEIKADKMAGFSFFFLCETSCLEKMYIFLDPAALS